MKKKQALKVLGCASSTLQRYVKKGYIRTQRLPNGFLLYNEEDVFLMAGKQIKKDNLTVAYFRVNKETRKGRAKMEEQQHLVHEWCIKRGIRVDRVYQDYGVGTNGYRKDFNRLIEDAMQGEIGVLVILTKCRLDRFSYYTMRKILRHHGVRIEVVAPHLEDPYYLDEQTEDLAKVMAEARLDRVPQKPD